MLKYVDHMGSDLSVVNAARISFAKNKTELDEKDVKLIQYLASHGHFTPFCHTAITFHIKCPVFVARQWFKHQVGVVINEVSGRYIQFEEDYFTPETFRQSAPNVKQGSSEKGVEDSEGVQALYSSAMDHSFTVYEALLARGVCKEQARAVLPLALNTEFYMTASLMACARIWKLRTDKHAQKETQEVARAMGIIVGGLFPYSWEALTK